MQMHFYFPVKVGLLLKNGDLHTSVFHTHFSSWIFKLMLCMNLALIPIVISQGTNNELKKGGGVEYNSNFFNQIINYQNSKFIQTEIKEIEIQ